MKRRGGKRESAGQKEWPALTKIMKEITQKHWTANHHYICLQNRVSRPGKRSVQFVRGTRYAESNECKTGSYLYSRWLMD